MYLCVPRSTGCDKKFSLILEVNIEKSRTNDQNLFLQNQSAYYLVLFPKDFKNYITQIISFVMSTRLQEYPVVFHNTLAITLYKLGGIQEVSRRI